MDQLLEDAGLARHAQKFAALGIYSREELAKIGEHVLVSEVGMPLGHARLLQQHLSTHGTVNASRGTASSMGSLPLPGLSVVQAQVIPVDAAAAAHAQYLASFAALKAASDNMEEPQRAADDTLEALAQLARDSAELSRSCAQYCGPDAVRSRVLAVLECAQQAAQRARWAAVSAVACADSEDHGQEWALKMRRAAVQDAELAERNARALAASVAGQMDLAGSTFCRFEAEGRCAEGAACVFGHDAKVLKPLPAVCKVELECDLFARGKCARGAGCRYAHGAEEVAEIMQAKYALTCALGGRHSC